MLKTPMTGQVLRILRSLLAPLLVAAWNPEHAVEPEACLVPGTVTAILTPHGREFGSINFHCFSVSSQRSAIPVSRNALNSTSFTDIRP
jgi:hypothetical protein